MISFTKSDIIKAIVVIACLALVLEVLPQQKILSWFNNGPSDQNAISVTGPATFNGTIRTYNPILAIPMNSTSTELIDELRTMEGVRDVSVKNTGGNYVVIQTETRDDVLPLAAVLKKKNLPVIGVANIVIPSTITLDSNYQKYAISTRGNGQLNGVIQFETGLFLEPDTEVPLSMIVVAQGGDILSYHSVQLLGESVVLLVNATVTKVNSEIYSYSIPWENRNSVPNLNESEYERVDLILFTPVLPITSMMTYKSLPYVTFIDVSSAQVLPDFLNKSTITSDFSDTNVTFPSSSLRIRGNHTLLPYPYTLTRNYEILLPFEVSGRSFTDTSLSIVSVQTATLNSTIPVTVSAVAFGSKLVVNGAS